jgi:energy-converting hydrogenase Eha subunit C
MTGIDFSSIKTQALLLAGLLVVIAAVYIIVKAMNGTIREAGKTTVIILIAAFVIAVGSHLEEVGNWIWGLFTTS